jgi:hypothetical protein
MGAARRRGRHRKPSPTARRIAIGGTGAAVIAGEVVGLAGGSAQAATATDFARLRQCESSGNYADNTGNGYYGAYQFDLRTWSGLGYTGLPSAAPPAVQDLAAERLQAARGWEPWPACSAKLGLTGSPSPTYAVASAATLSGPSAAPTSRTVPQPTAAPPYPGRALTAAMVGEARADVRAWQQRMRDRGWPISVDGRFGPQSAAIARAFEVEKGLTVDDGIVGPQVWNAAWTLPVT